MTTRHTSIHRRPDGELTQKAKPSTKQPQTAEANPMMQLQRSFGNKALGNMLSGTRQPSALPEGVQAKLTVGPAGDAYEQEADQVGRLVADRITASPEGGQSVQREEIEEESEELQMKRAPESIQREEIEEESEELQMKRAPEGIQREEIEEESEELQMKRAPEGIQREEIEEESEELQMKRAPEGIQREEIEEESEELQMKRSGEGFDADVELEQQIEQSRGSGSQMDTHVQAKMESAFGTGFEDVNIHTDGKADQMAESIGASAFTTGSDIFFRQGQYNPGSRQGQELLGHELTHVVQQRGGNIPTE